MSRPGDWNCRSCNHLNFQRRDSCQRCGDPRPGGSLRMFMGTGPDVRPGDWYCNLPNCGAHNFACRSSCFKCGMSKDESSSSSGGFDGGDYSQRPSGSGRRPGWKSGDWICSRVGCNVHNFASRRECFRCSAPRDSSP